MKTEPSPLINQKGFSLLLMVLIFLGVALVAYGAISIGIKLQQAGEGSVTEDRMVDIRAALKKYYRGQQDLPSNSPVPTAELGLESKYKNDAWGQQLYYDRETTSWDSTTRTDIDGLSVDEDGDGQFDNIAGVIISAGPDQTFQTFNSSSPPTTYPDTSWGGYSADNDDIIIGINVTEEAKEIAQEQMDVLRRKMWAHSVSMDPANPKPFPSLSVYGLPDSYSYDPWGNAYTIGTDGISASDGSFLPMLTHASPGGSTPPPVPTAGGDTIVDGKINFGNQLTGTVVGGVTASDDTATGEGTSLSFDGTGYVTIGNRLSQTNNLSAVAWVKPSLDPAATGDMVIMSKGYNPPITQWELKTSNTSGDGGRVWFRRYDNGAYGAKSQNPLLKNEWTHLAGTFKDGVWKLYRNCSLDNQYTDSITTLKETDRDVNIGGVDIGSTSIQNWYGLIDNPLIYSEAITLDDIAAICGRRPLPGLIAGWDFEQDNDTVAIDYNNDETLSGAITNATWSECGRYEGGMAFSNGSVTATFNRTAAQAAAGTGSGPYIPNGDVTYEMWFKTSSPTGTLQEVQGDLGGYDRSIYLVGGKLYFYIWDSVTFNGNTRVDDGQWHHLAFIMDTTLGFKAYVDGLLYANDPTATSTSAVPNFSVYGGGVGKSSFDVAYKYTLGDGAKGGYFNGYIDEVFIYNRVITLSEIQSRVAYAATQDFIAGWNFDEVTGSSTDNIVCGGDGVITGATLTSGPPNTAKSGKALFFDGDGDYVKTTFSTFPQGGISFEMWFKTTSPSGGLQVVGSTTGGCDRSIWLDNGQLYFNAYSNSYPSEVNFTFTADPSLVEPRVDNGIWHHLVYVLDTTWGYKAYVDGNLYAETQTQTSTCGKGCSDFNWANTYYIGTGRDKE